MESALFFFFGLALQPYVQLGMEWWLMRPRHVMQPGYFEHCAGCTL
jgi:hypothetical protein